MPTDEGPIDAHEMSRSANAPLLGAPFRSGGAKPVAVTAAVPADDASWRERLTSAQFFVLRKQGTEPPGSSESEGGLCFALQQTWGTKYPERGGYSCSGCGSTLYWANHKIGCGCGWPAFYDSAEGAVLERPDSDRTEIVCATCDGHLGHIFRGEGFGTPTDARHCVNGCALTYDPQAPQPSDIQRQYHLCLRPIPL